MKLFHLIKDRNNSIEKYGILSPRMLYKKNRELFHHITYKIYYDRARSYLNKEILTDEDVLIYLDEARKPLDSSCIFFNILSIENFIDEYKSLMYNANEYIIDSDDLDGQMYLLYKEKILPILNEEWLVKFYNIVQKTSKKHPTHKKFIFREIPHIAVSCNQVLPSQMSLIDYKSIDRIKRVTSKLGQFINYGFVDDNGNVHKTWDEEEFYDQFRMQDHDQILKSRHAICWEMTEIFRKIFDDLGFKNESYYICNKTDDGEESHSFNSTELNGIYIWDFKFSKDNKKNILGPFLSHDHALHFMIKKLYNENRWNRNNLYYSKIPPIRHPKGMTYDEYIKRLEYKKVTNINKYN